MLELMHSSDFGTDHSGRTQLILCRESRACLHHYYKNEQCVEECRKAEVKPKEDVVLESLLTEILRIIGANTLNNGPWLVLWSKELEDL